MTWMKSKMMMTSSSKPRMMARKVVKSRMTRGRTMMKMRHNVKMLLQQTPMSSPVYLQEGGAEVEVEEEVVLQVLVLRDQEADQEVADAWMDEHEVQA